jgi:hypothetical protein
MTAIRVACVLIALAWTAAATAVASPVLGKSKEWTIELPTGWREDDATASKARAQVTARKLRIQDFEIRVWRPEARGAALLVQWYTLPVTGTFEHAIDEFDRGVLDEIAPSSTAQDQSRQVVGSMVIRDIQLDQMGAMKIRIHMVRRYQPAKDGLHVLATMCMGGSPACDAALDGVQFTVRDPVSLQASGHTDAYRIGQAIGSLFLVGLLVLLLIAIRSMSRASSLKAAKRPGSPPGSGGAADGR